MPRLEKSLFLQSLCQICSDTQIGSCGKNAENEELGEWLWRKSEEITGVRFDKSVLETQTPFK